GYRIYRNGSLLVELGNVTNYTDTGLVNGVAYTYKVSAVNSIGEGPCTEEITAIPATVPSTPKNLRIERMKGTITLVWEKPSDNGGASITNYTIYRNGEAVAVIDANTTSYIVTEHGLLSYYVTATNKMGESEKSSEVVLVSPYLLLTPEALPLFVLFLVAFILPFQTVYAYNAVTYNPPRKRRILNTCIGLLATIGYLLLTSELNLVNIWSGIPLLCVLAVMGFLIGLGIYFERRFELFSLAFLYIVGVVGTITYLNLWYPIVIYFWAPAFLISLGFLLSVAYENHKVRACSYLLVCGGFMLFLLLVYSEISIIGALALFCFSFVYIWECSIFAHLGETWIIPIIGTPGAGKTTLIAMIDWVISQSPLYDREFISGHGYIEDLLIALRMGTWHKGTGEKEKHEIELEIWKKRIFKKRRRLRTIDLSGDRYSRTISAIKQEAPVENDLEFIFESRKIIFVINPNKTENPKKLDGDYAVLVEKIKKNVKHLYVLVVIPGYSDTEASKWFQEYFRRLIEETTKKGVELKVVGVDVQWPNGKLHGIGHDIVIEWILEG
ncbi:MAG: hypothetical protein QW115_05365, partial [Thermoplasmata archaeon]